MENSNKNTISSLLLMVGVLFITIAGIIFVSSNWHYVPDIVKRGLLVVLTAGLFGGYVLFDQKGLHKTSLALYTLGVCFTGFSVYSLVSITSEDTLFKLTLAQFAMLYPAAYQLWKRRDLLSVLTGLLVLDGLVFSLSGYTLQYSITPMCIAVGTAMLLISGSLMFLERNGESSTGLTVFMIIFYVIHLAFIAPFMLYSLFSPEHVVNVIACTALLCVSAQLLDRTYFNEITKFFKGFEILWAGLVASILLVRDLFGIDSFTMSLGWVAIIFLAYTLVLTLLTHNKFYYILSVILALTAAFIQNVIYLAYYWDDISASAFYPFTTLLLLALLAFAKFVKKESISGHIVKLSALLFLIDANNVLAFFFPEYNHVFGVFICVSLICLVIANITENIDNDMKKIFTTFAMVIMALNMLFLPANSRIAHELLTYRTCNFVHEYCILVLELSIVLLTRLWYHKNIEENKLVFASVTVGFVYLLLDNLVITNLPNVLFLAVLALFVLLLSAAKGSKKYTLLSSEILALISIYITRSIWLSISWWVYLFIAGVILVLVAIKKEKAE